MARLLENSDPNINELGLTTNKNGTLGGNYTFTGTVNLSGGLGVPFVLTGASSSALAVGLTGSTNPAFIVDTSPANQATGLRIAAKAAGANVYLRTISSQANENLLISAVGNGTLTLNDN